MHTRMHPRTHAPTHEYAPTHPRTSMHARTRTHAPSASERSAYWRLMSDPTSWPFLMNGGVGRTYLRWINGGVPFIAIAVD